MRKLDFWLSIAAWYLLLAGLVFAGINRFGVDYMERIITNPSAKVLALVVLFIVPIPIVVRRLTKP